MSYSQFHPRKNDFAFAFLMAGVFAVIVGVVAGAVNLAFGPTVVAPASEQATTVALSGSKERLQRVVPSGARQ